MECEEEIARTSLGRVVFVCTLDEPRTRSSGDVLINSPCLAFTYHLDDPRLRVYKECIGHTCPMWANYQNCSAPQVDHIHKRLWFRCELSHVECGEDGMQVAEQLLVVEDGARPMRVRITPDDKYVRL
eukprot:CAMPEP_0195645968 /NCGR_PEP_ID=MMETSP0815-20121206/29245_1 /TAXON_ID=97485 /ORGANISM="Prymnesium parvum, Strain Texoma1" /LENGTH=127 /DNA_ID=CAMNT_0040789299 /DNA_START=132 /DNA_END=513 /DNA_ORIENTATION=-